jgi:hypothetical protein
MRISDEGNALVLRAITLTYIEDRIKVNLAMCASGVCFNCSAQLKVVHFEAGSQVGEGRGKAVNYRAMYAVHQGSCAQYLCVNSSVTWHHRY